MARDPFEFDDYYIQDYTATVEKVEFVVSQYDNLQAVFTNRYDEPQQGNDGQLRTERPEFYSIGSADLWVPINGGTEFEHASGDKDKRIKSTTGYGLLVQRVVELLGREAAMARLDSGASNGGLYASSFTEGLRFHWVTEGAGKPWSNAKSGQSGVSKGHQLPVEYLPTGASAGAQSPTAAAPYDVASLGLDEQTTSDLSVYAKGLSLGEFQSKGISLLRDLTEEDVKRKLTVALSDSAFYQTLKQS